MPSADPSPTWADFASMVGAGAAVRDFLPPEAQQLLFPQPRQAEQPVDEAEAEAALPPTARLFQTTPSGEPLRLSWMRLHYSQRVFCCVYQDC